MLGFLRFYNGMGHNKKQLWPCDCVSSLLLRWFHSMENGRFTTVLPSIVNESWICLYAQHNEVDLVLFSILYSVK